MYFFLSYKLAFAFIKGSDYADTYRNNVAFLVLNPFETFKFQILVSKICIFPLPRKVWNTDYRADFDRNPENSLYKMAITVIL